jgi:hypothetical protein
MHWQYAQALAHKLFWLHCQIYQMDLRPKPKKQHMHMGCHTDGDLHEHSHQMHYLGNTYKPAVRFDHVKGSFWLASVCGYIARDHPAKLQPEYKPAC